MANLINPKTNMNNINGGGGVYHHYIAIKGEMPDGGDFSLCLAYKSRKAEPFQSAAAFCQELKNNGFVGTNSIHCFAIAVSGRITFTQIYGVFAPAEGQTVNGLGVMSDYEYWVTKDVNSLDFHDYVV